ncbi:MAG: hypothetical protein Q8Q15_01725 [bacterium]|nr:hypothetical protein [bacterium]
MASTRERPDSFHGGFLPPDEKLLFDHSLTFEPLPPEIRERRIQELREQMKNQEGEFVLVVTRSWETHGIGPVSRTFQTFQYVEECWHLGIITPPLLTRKGFNLIIHTPKYALSIQEGGYEEKIKTRGGSISKYSKTNDDRLEAPLKPDKKRPPNSPTPGLALEIIIGDEAVTAWFENLVETRMSQRYGQDFLKDLEEKGPNYYEEFKSRFSNIKDLVTFREMQKALGREIPLSEEESQKIDAEMNKRKVAALNELERLVRQERELLIKLAQIHKIKLPRITFGLDDHIYEEQVSQDEQDLRAIRSIPVNEEVGRIRGRIKEALEKAIKLEMHSDSWVFTRESTPGKTINIDVPRFIRGLCEYYEIKIPKKT